MSKIGFFRKCSMAFLSLLLSISLLPVCVFADEVSYGELLNGSFENGLSFTGGYSQVPQSAVPNWNTTATDEKIEFFRKNTGTYISGVTLEPSDGTYAAELNAEEESTLYQVVRTEPSSLYEWGLDHGARTEYNTMALIIGPKQDTAPSKALGEGYEKSELTMQNPPLRSGYKYGDDQFMQMVEWLKSSGVITDTQDGIYNDGKPFIVYSKKFSGQGGFQNNLDDNPFSLTPTYEHTEEWYIWIMTDRCSTSGTNAWGHYGKNNTVLTPDQISDYLYTVPEGQTETLFAFVSVYSAPKTGTTISDPTYGNFLDNITFNLYRKLNGSSTAGGTGKITADGDYLTSENRPLSVYVPNGSSLSVTATVKEEDKDNVSFAGFTYAYTGSDGTSHSSFIKADECTKTEDKGVTWTYAFDNKIVSATSIHFIFVKSPVITYDANGGTFAEGISSSYSFQPGYEDSTYQFKDPYTGQSVSGPEGWQFNHWNVYSENGYLGEVNKDHTVFCNYDNSIQKQNFIVTERTTAYSTNEEADKVTYTYDGNTLINTSAAGLTLVVDWSWLQSFSVESKSGTDYVSNPDAGAVYLTTGSGRNEINGYYASENETITAEAVAKSGYHFEGWFDDAGNLVTQNSTFTYVEGKGEVHAYHARFAEDVVQHFKRQIESEGNWIDVDDSDNSRVEALDKYEVITAVGDRVSATASGNAAYAFVGWYDEDGTLISTSPTLSYTASGAGTCYARFARATVITYKRQLVKTDGTVVNASDSHGTLNIYSDYKVNGATSSNTAYPTVNYSFAGWFDESGKLISTNPEFEVDVDGNATYFARFTPRQVTYKVNHILKNYTATGGNQTVKSETLTGTANTQVTPVPLSEEALSAYEGYICTEGIASQTISYKGSTVFNLYYTKTPAELTYKVNLPDGVTSYTGETGNSNGYVGWEVTVKNNGYAIAGYEFTGWNTKADGTGTAYPAGSTYTMRAVTDDTDLNVLYAQWRPRTDTGYTVEYYLVDGGLTLHESQVESGTTGESVTAVTKDIEGYEYTSGIGDYTSVTSGTVKGDGSLVLTLYYVPKTYTLSYDANKPSGTEVSGNVSSITDQYNHHVTVQNNGYVIAGYEFTGWNTEADGTGTVYPAGSDYVLKGDVTLYAVWERVPQSADYKVEHILLNSDYSVNRVYSEDVLSSVEGTVVSADSINIPNYSCLNGYEHNITSGTVSSDSSLVLKLCYYPNEDRLTYYANNGTDAAFTRDGYVFEKLNITENTFSYEGYVFIGWNTLPDGTGMSYAVNTEYQLTAGEDRLYAVWQEIIPEVEYVTVTYQANGGEGEDVITTAEKSSSMDVLNNPFEYASHRFLYWNTRPDGSGVIYRAGEEFTPEENMTLYAIWETETVKEDEKPADEEKPTINPEPEDENPSGEMPVTGSHPDDNRPSVDTGDRSGIGSACGMLLFSLSLTAVFIALRRKYS